MLENQTRDGRSATEKELQCFSLEKGRRISCTGIILQNSGNSSGGWRLVGLLTLGLGLPNNLISG